MEDQKEIGVRPGNRSDIGGIVALEESIYGPTGADCYRQDHVEAWLQVHPEGLLVAEYGTEIVGFIYSQRLDFDFGRLEDFRTHDQVTDRGYTVATHRPDGNALYGVTMCSSRPGAGWSLMAENFALARRLGTEYALGMSRLPRFGVFMEKNRRNGNINRVSMPEADWVRWYAMETAKAIGGLIWPSAGPQPNPPIPPLERPDPVLVHHLRFRNHGLAAILTEAMRDPPSRNHAALIVGRSVDLP